MIDQDTNLANKRIVQAAMHAIVDAAPDELRTALDAIYAEDADWRGSTPMDEVAGTAAIAATAWEPLRRALPDIERRDAILVGGEWEGTQFVAAMGHYVGRWERDWLGMPASGQVLNLRYGEVHQIEDGKIVRSTCLWDVLDAMHQCGPQGRGFFPLAPSWGTEMTWLAPFTNDGVVLSEQDAAQGAASLKQTLAMHDALGNYDDRENLCVESLETMPQRDFWHPKMMWYGPAGIGTGRGLRGFIEAHQLAFRETFPNRQGGAQITDRTRGGHYIRIGDGPYSVTAGWPSVIAMHAGSDAAGAPDLFGSGPTGNEVGMRVMDFYLHHEGLIRENWVPIDIIHLVGQMGIDVMRRMREQVGSERRGPRQKEVTQRELSQRELELETEPRAEL